MSDSCISTFLSQKGVSRLVERVLMSVLYLAGIYLIPTTPDLIRHDASPVRQLCPNRRLTYESHNACVT